MGNFGVIYLDKEKDIAVDLDLAGQELHYCIRVENHRTDNLIANLAALSGLQTRMRDGRTVITGTIPCYIKGDGQRVYIFRLGGVKVANIYPDGRTEVNSVISAIAKTMMSQTTDYRLSFRQTLVKSYVPEQVKLHTDLHTHGNANLNADILIALAIKHQLRYPLYYIKKLGLQLTARQWSVLESRRQRAEASLELEGLSGKHRDRRIDDNTFLNFADLILLAPEYADENIRRIRNSLSLLKDSQAVFTNLEKLYLYRYVFTKGQPSENLLQLPDLHRIPDADVRHYLRRALADWKREEYRDLTLYEDTLLWIGREYQKRHIRYVEISDTTLVKQDASAARMLQQAHRILPLVKAETGVDIRFLAAIRRIPLTLVKADIPSDDYLTQAMAALKVVCKDPYVVGSDFVGEEISDISELRSVIREIVQQIAAHDPDWTIRVHAGENDSLKGNMAKAIALVEEALLPGQVFPRMRIGHGLYCQRLSSPQGRALLEKIRAHGITLEFQLTSNVRLNNIIDLRTHPLKQYLACGIRCVMGTDGCGLYGTDSIDEQLALMNFLQITDGEFGQMQAVEEQLMLRQTASFRRKGIQFAARLGQQSVESYYLQALRQAQGEQVRFEIRKHPSFPVLQQLVRPLPEDGLPVILAGGSFTSAAPSRVSESDKVLLDALLAGLDRERTFFVIGHRLCAQEQYLLRHNPGFPVYCIVPALMTAPQLQRMLRAKPAGVRISTESQEMGIYKSFNYEIFERRSSLLLAFDGNSAVANLIQEARNGKGKARIFLYPRSPMLRAKAEALRGYVTVNAPAERVLEAAKAACAAK